jgi:predicted nucleic acid-binding protein
LRLIDDLVPGRVALDSAAFIYFIEEDGRYLPILKPVFHAIDCGKLPAATSALAPLEVLVVPYRNADLGLAERYDALLTRSRGLRFVDLDRQLLRVAAQLRASFKLKPPDAIQVAAALTANCNVFVTNDRRIPSIPNRKIIQLKEYL